MDLRAHYVRLTRVITQVYGVTASLHATAVWLSVKSTVKQAPADVFNSLNDKNPPIRGLIGVCFLIQAGEAPGMRSDNWNMGRLLRQSIQAARLIDDKYLRPDKFRLSGKLGFSSGFIS
jgi:hypothetical protein